MIALSRNTPPLVALALAAALLPLSDGFRDKRFIRIDPTDTMTVGFFFNIGFQLILPTLVPIDNARSFGSSPEEEPSTQLSSFDASEVQMPDDLQVDIGYMKQAQRIVFLFEYLQIYSMPCQERLICEMAADANLYQPLSEVILRDMKQRQGPVTESDDSLMWRYMSAARLGMTNGALECAFKYAKCQKPANQQVNMAVMKVWQYLVSATNINFLGIR